jgi:UDP:flavonoid glycosyltransferase YjiC (YdhE family)
MRLTAVTFGTEGDSRPLIALCAGLRAAGHDVVLIGERSAAPLAAAHAVPFVPLAGDMAVELRAAADGLARDGGKVSALARVLSGIAIRNSTAWMRALLDHAADADAILCAGLAIYVGLSAAEHLRIPAIGAGLQPVMPTRDFPSPFLPPMRSPGWVNRLSHRLVLAMMWRAFRRAVNDARRDVSGQAPRRDAWEAYPMVFGISPTLVPQPGDWDRDVRITGDWPLPHDAGWRAEASLREFLAAGDAPVYVGFGSMQGFDRQRFLETVLAALQGRRALLFGGWSNFGEGPLPDSVLRIGAVPHDWLFPQVSVAIHHGGAGTTHAAARAGVPAIVVPLAGDQFFWAERVRRLGIAPRPLAHAKLNARSLRERLALAGSAEMQRCARTVGDAMRNEHGVVDAVACIEEWMRGRAG